MPRRSRGKVILPVDDQLWHHEPDELGVLVLLHRAIILHGDRDRGAVDLADARRVCSGALQVFEQLVSSGVLKVLRGRVIVTTWPSCQGKADRKAREGSRRRMARHRDASRASKLAESNAKPQQPCDALVTQQLCVSDASRADNRAETQPEINGGVSGQDESALIEDNSQDLFDRRDQDPEIRSSIIPRSPNTIGEHVGRGQGVLFSTDVPDMARAVWEVWQRVEPLCRLTDPLPFLEASLQAYPDIDHREQAFKIQAWWTANPAKHAVRLQRLGKFINSWLAQAQAEHGASKAREVASDATVEAVWGNGG